MEEVKDDNNLKIKVIFVVVLLFLVGELIYFTKFSGIKILKLPEISVTALLFPSPAPTKQIQKPAITSSIAPKISSSKSAPKTSNSILNFQGKITSLNIMPSDNVEFSFSLETGSEWAKNYQVLFFNKTEMSVLTVFDSKGNIISYKDLKVGQNVKYAQEYELKNSPQFKIEIHVLE